MSLHRWLQNLRSIVAPRRGQPYHGRRGALRARAHRPHLEVLEDRCLLSFSPAVDYAINATPSVIATADFNNDGNLDLATCADALTGSISVLLGDGAGGFGAAQRYIVGSQLTSMAIADFNGDAKVDIVLADSADSALHLLMGNGDGTFQPAVTRVQWSYVWTVAAGHFNNDSNADLLVTLFDWNNGWSIFQVQLGNGQGGFADSDQHPWQPGAPSGGAMPANLNNDGKLDMITPAVEALLGNGDGSLQYEFYYGLYPPLNGVAVATGDFTGDGLTDLVVAGYGGLAVLRGKGDGDFLAPVAHSANGTNHTGVATADFNADGQLDAVVSDVDAGTVSLMLGNGDGTLDYAGAFATGSSPTGVVVGDFNRDGRPDVAVSNAGSSRNVSVLLNDGVWSPVPPPPPSIRIHDVTVTEGNAGAVAATLTVTLSAASTEMITVAYATGNGSASADGDYQAVLGTLTFAPGETSKTITVPVNGDRLAEPNETFFVNLSSPTNATIADGQGVGTIVDDEPRISISDVTKYEGKRGKTTLFTFTVTLSAAYDQAATMSFRTVNGTATTSDKDYVAKTGTLTFAPGETTKTITIEVKGDSKREANETFYLDLFGNSGNSLFTRSRGIGTILNDD